MTRRLIHGSADVTAISMPSGDSIGSPGWDGIVEAAKASAWVPAGSSYWEVSCEAEPTSKANREYNKRIGQTDSELRASGTFIFVTPRKWPQKTSWIDEKQSAGEWQGIRAYDAFDLEEWLEQTSPVALWFAELLGLTGPGLESLERRWEVWAQQTSPELTRDAIVTGRNAAREALLKRIGDRRPLSTVRADSVEEGVAFAVASILDSADATRTTSRAVVVTSADGWRFVDANPGIEIAVVARPELFADRTLRDDLIVILPLALGDPAARTRQVGDDPGIVLERPRLHEFEEALIGVGVDRSDAARWARSTSRSWSVYRRQRARNPGVVAPPWMSRPEARALATVCLVGAWDSERLGDQAVLEAVAGRPYEELDKDLRAMAGADDAPILLIGSVWKARSPLELLHLYGGQITRGELDRFFTTVKAILVEPDPALELPADQRYAAQVFGKVRAQSGLLIESLCDSLVKLAVIGPDIDALAALSAEERVAVVVRELLHDADGERWLSLAGLLREFAEAAPREFLAGVERSLAQPAAPVSRLISETGSAGSMTGRCWHASLLWALELLAWNPLHLGRVAVILTRLSEYEIKGNWGNTPLKSLISLFRVWLPQTSAPVGHRINVLDKVITQNDKVGWHLLCGLGLGGPDVAFSNGRPRWRDDDSGAGHSVAPEEYAEMLGAVGERLRRYGPENPERLARLIGNLRQFPQDWQREILNAAGTFMEACHTDDDRAELRAALRDQIYWLLNYENENNDEFSDLLIQIVAVYSSCAPMDIVVRHRWLFDKGWVRLPEPKADDRYELLDQRRCEAVQEVLSGGGPEALERLIQSCSAPHLVGHALAAVVADDEVVAGWAGTIGGSFVIDAPLTKAISGYLYRLPHDRRLTLCQRVLTHAIEGRWEASRIAAFLTACPCDRSTWDLVGAAGTEIDRAYWDGAWPNAINKEPADRDFALRRLLAAGRARAAFQTASQDLKALDAKLLLDLLDQVRQGIEPEGILPDSWDLAEAIGHIEAAGVAERPTIAALEFGFYSIIERSERGAKTLFAELMSIPSLFTQLVCLVFPPSNADPHEPLDEKLRAAAENAWHVLNDCRRLPGTDEQGRVDPAAFRSWTREVRRLCREVDRAKVAEQQIGQILAHSPDGADGAWPCEVVRDLLDEPDAEEIRSGFFLGAINKRGVTSRAYDDGGDQERVLAAAYKRHAEALQGTHPYTADTLIKLARDYESDAMREDISAKLRIERG